MFYISIRFLQTQTLAINWHYSLSFSAFSFFLFFLSFLSFFLFLISFSILFIYLLVYLRYFSICKMIHKQYLITSSMISETNFGYRRNKAIIKCGYNSEFYGLLLQ